MKTITSLCSVGWRVQKNVAYWAVENWGSVVSARKPTNKDKLVISDFHSASYFIYLNFIPPLSFFDLNSVLPTFPSKESVIAAQRYFTGMKELEEDSRKDTRRTWIELQSEQTNDEIKDYLVALGRLKGV